MSRTAFILGGAGQIGRAIAFSLACQGWRVRVAGRGERPLPQDLVRLGVETVRCDRETPGALGQALGSGADAMIDCVAFTQQHGRQLLEHQAAVGSFVVVSSASVYKDGQGRTLDEAAETGFPDFGGPLAETHATVAPGPHTYSTNKVALERTVLDGAKGAAIVLRPCAVYGPGSTHAREWWFLKRALDGRTRVPIAYNGESRFHTASTVNIAEVCRVALAAGGSRILNVGDPDPPTVRRIGEAIRAAIGGTFEIVGLPGPPRETVGGSPWSIKRPVLVDMSAASALGYIPAGGYPQLVPATCRALVEQAAATGSWECAFPQLARYPYPLFDYAAEEVVLRGLAV